MTRQVERQNARVAAKAAKAIAYAQSRKDAKRELLERQTLREKACAYAGRSVAAAFSPSRSRLDKRLVRKGKPFGRIIHSSEMYGRKWSFHATKGWRFSRAA